MTLQTQYHKAFADKLALYQGRKYTIIRLKYPRTGSMSPISRNLRPIPVPTHEMEISYYYLPLACSPYPADSAVHHPHQQFPLFGRLRS